MADTFSTQSSHQGGIPLRGIFILLLVMVPVVFGSLVFVTMIGVESRAAVIASLVAAGLLMFISLAVIAHSVRIDRERRQAWRVLTESSARSRAMLASAPNPIVIYDSEGLALYINPAFTRVFGWSMDEIVGRRIDFVPDDQREITTQAIRNVYAHTDRVYQFDTQRFTRGGDLLDISITAAVFLDDDGAAQGMAVNLEDITERKRTETRLRESEARFRVLHEASFGGIGIHDHGVILDANSALAELTGYTLAELTGMDGLKLIAPEWRDTVRKNILSGFETPYEVTGLRKDGSTYPLEIQGKNIPYQGRTVRVTEFRDITLRRKTEDALRESEMHYRRLAESITDVIWTLDLDMRFTYVSPAAEKLQGWSVADMLTMGAADVMHPESLARVMAVFAEEYGAGEASGDFSRSVTIEVELLRREGGTISAEVTAAFVLGVDGLPIGVSGVTRDITERRRAQAETEALQEQLSRLKKMEALGLLAGGVAHDLNNVLSGIASYPDLILMDMPKDSPLRRPLETIRASGQKAATIVQDLLTLARRGVVTTEVINLTEIVEDYLFSPEHARLMADHPAVRVETAFEPDLPNIEGSSVHLRKTVMNLVSNAAEALTQGGALRIRTESRFLNYPLKGYDRVETGEYVVLQVTDEGQGISENDLPHIFEPFYTRKVMGRSGTGLGMAVVWGTVQDHRGYIDMHSTVGTGTVFELYFPMSRKKRPEAAQPIDLSTVRGDGETILVVDDAQDQREIASRMLEVLNYTVTTADSGEAALSYLKTHGVDLIVLDMIMDPGIDGLETYRRIVREHPAQRAIIASGYAETDRVKAAQRLGAGEYIKKPYTLERLAKAAYCALHPGASGK